MPYKQSLGLWEENINRNTIYLLLITQRCSQALWSRSAAPTWAEHQHTARALGSVWLRCVSVGTGICQVQTLVQLGTATHTSLLQFKSKPYTLAEHFNQGKSHGNVLLPPPSPDCCVCKQKPLKGLICPLSLLSTQTYWAQEPSWHFSLHFLFRLEVAWVFLLITYRDLRSTFHFHVFSLMQVISLTLSCPIQKISQAKILLHIKVKLSRLLINNSTSIDNHIIPLWKHFFFTKSSQD